MAAPNIFYQAEPADGLIIEPLDVITLVYHRRSGVTHMVAEPVPEMLDIMGRDIVDAPALLARLHARFDLGDREAALISIEARLKELADLGLVHRVLRDV
jgi:PqqD family protein of HPr-rel-A system